jgi:putative FmdB family regulatory protein
MAPLYDFQCQECEQEFEVFWHLMEYTPTTICPICNGSARQIIKLGHGGVHRDDPVWLDDEVRGCLQSLDQIKKGKQKPITTRQEYKKHLKDNHIAPIE